MAFCRILIGFFTEGVLVEGEGSAGAVGARPGPVLVEAASLSPSSNSDLLNVGSIRIYILTIGVVSNETNTYVRMYTWRIYSSRDLDTLLHKLELNKHWKNAALYTLATKD